MVRIPIWLWCTSANYIWLHIKSILWWLSSTHHHFQKSLIVISKDLFQPSASGLKWIDGVTVTRFTFYAWKAQKMDKYMKHWFSRHYVSWGEVLLHPRFLPMEVNPVLAGAARSWLSVGLSSRCVCYTNSPTRIVSPGLRWLASMPHPHTQKQRDQRGSALRLIITRIHITFLHGGGEMTFYPTLHQ